MTHTLIYIGASILQVPAIGWAKTQGLRVVVTDMNPDAPGIAFADEYAQLSGDNVDGIVALAGEVSCSTTLVGCYCGSDFGLPAVSAVAEHFDVPGPSRESVNLSLNKSAAISVMRDHGVTVPKGSVVNSHEELVLEANRLGFPVIVKPADSSGSRGVRAVKCAEYLACAYDEAKKFSSKIMVESCVRGHHVDVNGLFVEGTFYPCGMLSRFFSPPPYNYPTWGCEPPLIDVKKGHSVYEALEAGARSLGITEGPVKGDMIISDREVVVLEIAPRFHGDVSTSFVTPLATGQSAPQAWFAHLAGNDFKALLPIEQNASIAGWLGIFPKSPGAFAGLEGTERALAIEGIERVQILKRTGYRVEAVSDNLAVMAFVWGRGKNAQDLENALKAADAAITVNMVD